MRERAGEAEQVSALRVQRREASARAPRRCCCWMHAFARKTGMANEFPRGDLFAVINDANDCVGHAAVPRLPRRSEVERRR